ncbi:ankyrin repeat domain-containing protein [Planctomycetota bacterium]
MEALTHIGRYLISQSWQIVLLTLIIAMASFALRNKSAHVRYLLWLIILAKCLVPPLLTVPVAVLPTESPVETTLLAPFYQPVMDLAPSHALPMRPVLESTPMAETGPVMAEQSHKPTLPQLALYQWVTLIWILGVVLYGLFALCQAVWSSLWLHKRRRELPRDLALHLQKIFADLDINVSPKLWLVKGIAQPFVWGLWRGSIYLPMEFAKIHGHSQRQDILIHELNHVRRYDALVNLLQIFAQTLFWFHPLTWWANHRIRIEREKCCDETTIAWLGTRAKDYGQTIVNTIITEYESTRPAPSLAIAGPLKSIEERIRSLMKPGKRFYRRPSVVVVMIVLAFALMTVPTALVLTVHAATEIDMVPPHTAASQGDIAAVEHWLAQGGDVNTKNEAGETLLRIALRKGHQDIIQLLEKHGADINAEIQNDPSLIRRVATDGNHEVADLLISRGADTSHVYVASYLGKLDQVKEYIESGSQQVSMSDKNGILWGAITGGHADIIEYILDHGADIKRWENVDVAVCANRKHILELLIAKGADPNPGRGWSPLHMTTFYYRRLEMAKVLLSHGADPFKSPSYTIKGPWDPMHYAIEIENKDMVQLFLDHHRDTDLLPYAYYAMKENSKDVLPLFEPYLEISPIHLACFYGKLDDVKSYLEQGNDIEAQTIGGLSLLQFAVVGCQMEIVDYLIAQGCNINSKASHGATALHFAANGNGKGEEMVQRLITADALVEAKDNDNCTPFFYSLSGASDDLGAAQVLLQHGADINIQSKGDGVTALHDAANRGSMDRIKWLIAKGADVNRRMKDGNTPLGVAMNRDRFGAVKYFLEHRADINCHDERGRTPLHYAAMSGMKEIVEMVLNKGADINSRDNWGQTPLHSSVLSSRKEIVEILLKKDADMTVQDSTGRTAIGFAKGREYAEIAELLSKRAKQLDPNKEIMTICDYAAIGDTEKIRSLIAAGQDDNSKSKNGGMALYWALMKGHMEIAELLIQNGANVNFQDPVGGWTPLLLASISGKKEIVELLLANGAELNAKITAGSTSLDLASQRKHTEIVELLKKHGAK